MLVSNILEDGHLQRINVIQNETHV